MAEARLCFEVLRKSRWTMKIELDFIVCDFGLVNPI